MAKNKLQIFVFVAALLMVFSLDLIAQFHDTAEGGGKPDPQLSQKDNDYLDRQAKVFLDSVSVILEKYPPLPVKQEALNRAYAKLLLDAVFHEHFAAFRKPAQEFFHQRINDVIHELENSRVENGAQVWKIYNMGFIVRTASVTIAFDLVSGNTSGSADFALSGEEINRLVKQCDILFISHRHEDHAEKQVAEKFISQRKQVIAPEQVWTDDPIYQQIKHLERNANILQTVDLGKCKLEVTVFPGHQMRSIDNNVTWVKTPEEITLAHMGDQINEGDFMIDFDWIDHVKENYEVDILMPAAWTMDIFRIVQGFNPKLVLPGHELELGHTVWDRLPFWGDTEYLELTYDQLKSSGFSVAILTWGDPYRYIPEK